MREAMTSRTVWALLETLFSYFSVSLGFVLQKKGIGWLSHHGKKDAAFFQNLALWSIGFILLNLAVLPNYLALRVLNAYIVNAVSGLNIVFMVFLSGLVLKEKIHPLDYLYTLVMCLSIALINLADRSGAAVLTVRAGYAFGALSVPLGIFILWFLFQKRPFFKKNLSLQAILLAASGGGMSGLMVTYLKILQMKEGGRILAYLSSPYLYCFFTVSILSLVAVQYAYRMGAMILVGPAQFATMVFYPVLASYFIFAIPVNLTQVFCFALIIVTVFLMVHRHHQSGTE